MARHPETLFVACTRPAMKWGVPFEGYVANLALTTVFAAGVMGNPCYFLVGVAVHFVMREKAKTEPHFFHLWRLWFETKARSITAHVWGGSRLQPSPAWARSARDITSSV